MHTIVTAFDIATATGACDGALETSRMATPRLWTWRLEGETVGARLHCFACLLNNYFETEPCDRVVYELPMPIAVMTEIGATESVVALLRGAVGVLLERCHAHSKPVEGMSVQSARRAVLGWSTNSKKSGEKTKVRVMREVRSFFKINPANDNEADAFVVWSAACARMNPRLASAMTPLFRDVQ